MIYGNEKEGVMGAQEKIEKGRAAVKQLALYKQAKKGGDKVAAQAALANFNQIRTIWDSGI